MSAQARQHAGTANAVCCCLLQLTPRLSAMYEGYILLAVFVDQTTCSKQFKIKPKTAAKAKYQAIAARQLASPKLQYQNQHQHRPLCAPLNVYVLSVGRGIFAYLPTTRKLQTAPTKPGCWHRCLLHYFLGYGGYSRLPLKYNCMYSCHHS